ncbi:MAG TPA: hypothetical protein VGA36_07855 [Nitriliruptorales bacterium]
MHDERSMARTALRVGGFLAPVVLLAVALAGRGTSGVLTAVGALALVVGNFYVTGRAFHWAGRVGPTAVQAVALGGFLVKLVVLAAVLVALHDVRAVDGPVLAITTALATIVLLATEVRLVLTHAEFWWLTEGKATQ